MKKILRFMRSMRFGIILLITIAILCVLATVLNMESIYHSWYFITLFALLSANLVLCSVLRVRGIGARRRALLEKAKTSEMWISLPMEKQETWLKRNAFKKHESSAYLRFGAGMFGSFITHLALMLLLIAAACNFMLADKNDYSIFVGDSVHLTDGTSLMVDAFSTEGERGETLYTSEVTATLPDGSMQRAEIRVNYPVRIGRYKVYQQAFSTCAVIGVRTGIGQPEERVCLDDSAFLSLDGTNGIYYIQLFGNVIEDETGVQVSSSGDLICPAYEIQKATGSAQESGLVYPGTTLEVGGVYYTMYEPERYPILRVKIQPEWTLWFLYLAFALMVTGLFLCFFHTPVAAVRRGDGIGFAADKDIDDWVESKRLEAKEDESC
jgi:cytochrome c biogenesis protein